MEISYLGHASFKIKTKAGTLVTDPYDVATGLKMPTVSGDIVTASHDHHDHNNIKAVSGTARRKEPFAIREPGEYEVEGISVFGYRTYHDGKQGEERGENTIFVVQAEDLRVLHLGDLGHKLTDRLIDELDGVDVLMIPVGGVYTIDAKQAAEIVKEIEPTYILPMHYKTKEHNQQTFGKMDEVGKFLEALDYSTREVKTLSLTKAGLPPDSTEIVVFG